MTSEEIPTGREFIGRLQLVSGTVSLVSIVLISIYLFALLQLTSEQWRLFASVVAGLFLILFPVQAIVHGRIWLPIKRYLDLDGQPTSEEVSEAFEAAVNLPLEMTRWGVVWWGGGGVLTAGSMLALSDSLSLFSAMILVLSAMSGGFVMVAFHFFIIKRETQPIRDFLGEQIADPLERQKLVTPISIRKKLLISVTGVMVTVVVFTVFLARVRSDRRIEAITVEIQREMLEQVASEVASQGDHIIASVIESDAGLGLVDSIGLLDSTGSHVVAGDLAALVDEELAAIQREGLSAGDSLGFATPNVISWRRMADGRVLVALTGWKSGIGSIESIVESALLVLGSALIAFALVWLVARDISGATASLGNESRRLTSGDLRRAHAFESEDELGALSRSFEATAGALRTIVAEVAEAANRVESTAVEIASVSSSVSTVSANQKTGIEQASTAMHAINSQAHGIAISSQGLNDSIEESSSSILELGASGRDLNDTAGALSTRVDEVTSAIDQMVGSVTQVADSTESLTAASEETSASMAAMFESMAAVERIAGETAQLSHQVVGSAEKGQQKVQQTVSGMDEIRAATGTAAEVIENLGGRTREIGAIVDVIDDIADETNLLALNAAIIAAQAGESGKAFSVVADEIKELADRVLVSTKEIGGLIHAVQDEGNNAITAIDRGTQSVNSGVALSAEAGASLEEITRISHDSGTHIEGIVDAVRTQVSAASDAEHLMDRVRVGFDAIRDATIEQKAGNLVMSASAMTMREVAHQVRGTTEEQARGTTRIRDNIERVREAVEEINRALQEQSVSCRGAVEILGEVESSTGANEKSARRMDAATKGLMRQSARLRKNIQRFRI